MQNATDNSNNANEQPTSLELANSLVAINKASGDPLRLEVLRLLSHDSYAVQELCDILQQKQSGLSHHLKVLFNASLVTKRREGNTLFYRRNTQHQHSQIQSLLLELFRSIDLLELSDEINERLTILKQQRAASSAEFFERFAEKFAQQQEQVAPYELYSDHTRKLLSDEKKALCLELGPGDGRFLSHLSPLFEKVVALDNSTAMLNIAKQSAAQSGIQNIEFFHGDTKHHHLKNLQADCIVLNMVLHHTPSPAEVISDLADILKPGGQLIVTELCEHDQAWVQEVCGDLWLGIKASDLSDWAEHARLNEKRHIYLNQLNGFGVQVREFIKPKIN